MFSLLMKGRHASAHKFVGPVWQKFSQGLRLAGFPE
jgi:hypothetical protein